VPQIASPVIEPAFASRLRTGPGRRWGLPHVPQVPSPTAEDAHSGQSFRYKDRPSLERERSEWGAHDWRRTWWTVWWANLVAAVGLQSFLPFFPTHLEHLGMRERDEIALWAGLLYGAAPFSAALVGPLWGALGDRMGRKLMVLRSLLAIAVFVGLMGFAETPGQLLVLRLLQGLFSGFVAPSATLVSVGAPAGRQGRVAGSLQTALAGGSIVGPLLGGVAAGWIGLRPVFWLVAALALLAAAGVALWAVEDHAQRARREGERSPVDLLRGIGSDIRELSANPRLRGGLWIAFWTSFALGGTSPILELHVRELAPGGADGARLWTSVVFSAAALANLALMPPWGRRGDRIGHARAMVESALLGGALLAVQAVPLFSVLLVARALFGGATAGATACSFGLAAAETRVERRGGAFGLMFSARTLAAAIGAPLCGWASRWIGMEGVFVLAGAALCLSAAGLRGDYRRPSARSAAGG
jgi:MFS family permease